MIKVRATQPGYFAEKRIREGDEFVLAKPEQFSDRWMDLVGDQEEIKANEKAVRKVLDAKAAQREERQQVKLQSRGLPQAFLNVLAKLQQENQALKARLEGQKPQPKAEPETKKPKK